MRTPGQKPNNAKLAARGTPTAIYEIGAVTTPHPAPNRHELTVRDSKRGDSLYLVCN